MTSQVFEVPNSGSSALLTFMLVVPAVLLVILAMAFWPRPVQIEVTSRELKISGSVYARTLARADLVLDDARGVDLRREPALMPVQRSNGIGLPNYQVGWFRLRDGQRALCFLTRRDSVIYLPTSQNFVLLLSVSEPDQLLEALRK